MYVKTNKDLNKKNKILNYILKYKIYPITIIDF